MERFHAVSPVSAKEAVRADASLPAHRSIEKTPPAIAGEREGQAGRRKSRATEGRTERRRGAKGWY